MEINLSIGEKWEKENTNDNKNIKRIELAASGRSWGGAVRTLWASLMRKRSFGVGVPRSGMRDDTEGAVGLASGLQEGDTGGREGRVGGEG